MSKIEELREKANLLPLLPGVYLMKDAQGQVIYVGKAKALKNRVTSYFRGEHNAKTTAMVAKVDTFDVIVAASELEALVLENSLIKRHRPHYNILLKDDKGYPFIRLDVLSQYPRFTLVNKTAQDGARYFGPFGSRGLSGTVIDTLCKTLRLPTCGRRFPGDIGKGRPCLNYHLDTCAGYCLRDTDPAGYAEAIHQAEMVLDGRSAELLADLERRMNEAAEALRFELAADLRDRMRAIQALSQKQRVIAAVLADTDAVGFFHGAKCCFTVLHYQMGDLADKEYTLLEEPAEENGPAVTSLVRQYYARRGSWPREILVPEETEDKALLEQLFTQLAGRAVYVTTPKRGHRVRLLERAMENAREEVARATTEQEKRGKTLAWLGALTGLDGPPHRIEAFDISNTGDENIVAAMTVFQDGRPLKRDYRKFRIQGTGGQDDFGSMREAVTRRFQRYLDGDEHFALLPDLLLIDGGAVHAGVAVEALRALGLSLPVYGMVKDDRHRTRALVSPAGEELGLTGNPAGFALVGNIQEETHRTAIRYHRSLRDAAHGSALDKIPGVGEKRRLALLREFKSVAAIRRAEAADLARVVPKNTAQAIYDYYHPTGEEEEDGCE